MRLGVLAAKLNSRELSHYTVADVARVLGLVSLTVRDDSELDHLGIGAVVEAEEVGAGLLKRALVLAQGGGGHSRKELTAAVAEAFVQVGVDLVHHIAVFFHKVYLGLVPCELGQHALRLFERGGVVGVGDIGDGDALGAVLFAYPVGVRKVDSYRGRRIGGPCQRHCVDDLGGDAPAFGLLEARIHGGVVFEPLGIGAKRLGSGRCRRVLDVHEAFPGGLAAERVVVVFDEAVHVVHRAKSVLHPEDVVVVPGAEAAGGVVFYEFVDCGFLEFVLGDLFGLFELAADALDGG